MMKAMMTAVWLGVLSLAGCVEGDLEVSAEAHGVELRGDFTITLMETSIELAKIDDQAVRGARAAERDGERETFSFTSPSGGEIEYDCGTLTCTCYNTMDCLAMAWEATDGPCSDTGEGKTCCISAC